MRRFQQAIAPVIGDHAIVPGLASFLGDSETSWRSLEMTYCSDDIWSMQLPLGIGPGIKVACSKDSRNDSQPVLTVIVRADGNGYEGYDGEGFDAAPAPNRQVNLGGGQELRSVDLSQSVEDQTGVSFRHRIGYVSREFAGFPP